MSGDEPTAIEFDYDKEIDIKPGAGIFSRPFFWNGKAYFGAFDKRVYCIDAKSGTHIWDFASNGIISAYSTVVDGVIYITSWDGFCYALNADTGELIWKFRTGGRCLSHPVFVEGRLFFGSNDKKFYCLDADGKQIWKFLTGNINNSGCAIVNDQTIFTSYDHHVYSLEKNTGKLQWKFRTGGHLDGTLPTVVDNNFNVVWDMDNKTNKAVTKEGIVLAGSSDRHLYAITLDGQFSWKFFAGSWPAGAARVFGKHIYFPSYDGHIYCLNSDGSFRWRYVTGAGTESTPLVHKNMVFFGSMDTNFYALDLDGYFKWRFKMNGGANSSPAVYENKLYISSFDGNLYCLTAEGELVWRFMTGFGEMAILADSTKSLVGNVEKSPIMTFFKPGTIQDQEKKHGYETKRSLYSMPTDPIFMQEASGLYRSQPTYKTMSSYLDKKKDKYTA